MRYQSTNKTVHSANYHLIWCPKYRRRVLADGVDARLKAIVAEVGAEVIEIEVMPRPRASAGRAPADGAAGGPPGREEP